MFETLFGVADDTSASISAITAITTIVVAFVVGLIISITYMKTSDRGRYSRNFALTMVLTPAVVSVIILLIGSNIARAFSLAGAFSIIRFRSAPGDPKDIAYVLFTMASGLAAGTGLYGYALLFTVLLCVVMVVLHVARFGSRKSSGQMLKINVPENVNYEEAFVDVFERFADRYELMSMKTTDLGSLYQLVYNVILRDDSSRKEFLDTLRCRNGNLNITLSTIEENYA